MQSLATSKKNEEVLPLIVLISRGDTYLGIEPIVVRDGHIRISSEFESMSDGIERIAVEFYTVRLNI